jgi:hypothetical protein
MAGMVVRLYRAWIRAVGLAQSPRRRTGMGNCAAVGDCGRVCAVGGRNAAITGGRLAPEIAFPFGSRPLPDHFVFRITSTEHFACVATASDTLPSTNRVMPRRP